MAFKRRKASNLDKDQAWLLKTKKIYRKVVTLVYIEGSRVDTGRKSNRQGVSRYVSDFEGGFRFIQSISALTIDRSTRNSKSSGPFEII